MNDKPNYEMPIPERKETRPIHPGHERRHTDRRRRESDGYTYVPVAGWICRREKCRRVTDKPSW